MATGEILFFLCLNDRGGAEISMLTLAKGMQARGRAVTLAVYGAKRELARESGFSGAIIDLGARRTAAALLPLWRLLLSRFFRGRPFTALISALPYTNIAASLAIFLTPGRPRLILTEHGVEGLTACEKSPAFRRLVRFCYKRAAVIVVVSQKLAQIWREALPPALPVVTIYNPVVGDALPVPHAAAHLWLGGAVIMGVGRLKPGKNFALLIRAFVLLAAGRDLRLIILGDGEQKQMLQDLAVERGVGDKVLLPGFVGDVAAWLPHAALFVSPSDREGFGNAIVEALAYGVPVVATDCPYGPSEILQRGRYGYLAPVNDVEALARIMAQALDAPPDKQAGQNRALHFTVAQSIDGYLALVDKEA